MIAALRGKRNCICLEDNPLLFINSKINMIGSMQDKEQEESVLPVRLPEKVVLTRLVMNCNKEQDDNA